MSLAPCLSCSGKVFIITGANSGIGYETTRQLMLLGGHVVMACRNGIKAKEAIQKLQRNNNFEVNGGSVKFINLTLDGLDSVAKFAKVFLQSNQRLDGLICSAGVNSSGAPDADIFVVNYISHAHLILLLTNILRKTGTASNPARVVTLSSAMHVAINKPKSSNTIVWNNVFYESTMQLSSYTYSYSKLGLHLIANYINKHEKNILGIAVNPGAVNSNIWRGSNQFIKLIAASIFLSSQQGCQPVVHAVASPSVVLSKNEYLYVTPYYPILASCTRCSPSFCRRGFLLLSNVIEAAFGRCLYRTACFGEASAVANDIKEAEHLFEYTSNLVKEHEDQKKYGDDPDRFKSDHPSNHI